jgi:Iron-sulfur cluster assembly accessory protein
MVTVMPEAAKFINDLLVKNEKVGYGVKIYLAGMACSGPQFGMSFQEGPSEGDTVFEADGFSLFYDGETQDALDGCVIEYVDDPNFGTGLTIRDPNAKGCSSCGGGCH